MQNIEAQAPKRWHEPPIQRLRVELRASAEPKHPHAVDCFIDAGGTVIRNECGDLDSAPDQSAAELLDDGFDAPAIRGVVFANV